MRKHALWAPVFLLLGCPPVHETVATTLRAQNEADETVQICFYRMDTEEELRCVPGVPAGRIATYQWRIAQPGPEGIEIRAYATNFAGLRSGPSNAYYVGAAESRGEGLE